MFFVLLLGKNHLCKTHLQGKGTQELTKPTNHLIIAQHRHLVYDKNSDKKRKDRKRKYSFSSFHLKPDVVSGKEEDSNIAIIIVLIHKMNKHSCLCYKLITQLIAKRIKSQIYFTNILH